MSYSIVKNYTLKDTVEEITRWLNGGNTMAENGKIINGVTDRDTLRANGAYRG